MLKHLNKITRDSEYKEQEKHVLICIDNAEGLIEAEDLNVRIFLSKLLSECCNLSVLLSLRKPIGALEGSFKGYIQFLDPLTPIHSVELFIENIGQREINAEEIFDLLVLDKDYPFHKLEKIKAKIDSWDKISCEDKSELIRKLSQETRVQN